MDQQKLDPILYEFVEFSKRFSAFECPFEMNTLPGTISTTMPKACGITRISEKIIDASRSKRRNGCIVTSQANSGVRQILKKSFCFRTAFKSKMMLEQLLHVQCDMIPIPGILVNIGLLDASPKLVCDSHLHHAPLSANHHFSTPGISKRKSP